MSISDSGSSSGSSEPWSSWFTRSSGKHYFTVIDPAYIADSFNLYGIRAIVPQFNKALLTIMDREGGDDDDSDDTNDSTKDDRNSEDSELLYGLVHARWVISVQVRRKRREVVHVARSARSQAKRHVKNYTQSE